MPLKELHLFLSDIVPADVVLINLDICRILSLPMFRYTICFNPGLHDEKA